MMKNITKEEYEKLTDSINKTKELYDNQYKEMGLLFNQLVSMNQESDDNRKRVKEDPSYLSLKKTLIDMNSVQLDRLKDLIKRGTDSYYDFDEIEHLEYAIGLTKLNDKMLNRLRENRDLLRRCLIEFDRFEKSIL